MTKTKRQLRADAPELRDTWSKYYDPETRTYNVPCDELFADTDAPATDTPAPISDNVRECPQSDAVEVLRTAASTETPIVALCERFNAAPLLPSEHSRVLNKLADMVERDYVNRAIFDAVCVKRDKLTSMVEDATADFAAAVKQRDEARADAERWRVQFNECDEENISLRKERDYWKARAERYPYDHRIVGNGRDWGEIMRDAFDSLMSTAGECCTDAELMALDSYIMQEMRRGTAESCRQYADLGKRGDGADDENDGVERTRAEYLGTLEPETSQVPEYDTCEKLEADVRDFANIYYTSHLLVYDEVIKLLDRQASITERECKCRTFDSIETAESIAAYEVDNAKLAHERDYWRGKCGMLLDAAHEMTRIATLVDGNGEVLG